MAVAPHTARFLSCPHMYDVSPQLMSSFNTLGLHGLTTLFLPKHLWGSISAFCNYPQRFQSWGSFSAFCTIPKIFPIGQTFQSLSILRRYALSDHGQTLLSWGSPSSGWAVSHPHGSWPSSTTHIDPCNGCLLGTEPRYAVLVVNHCG